MNERVKNQTLARRAARRTTFVASSLAALLLMTAGAGTASAHPLGYDSVDEGEIVYRDRTRYDEELGFAAREWNELDRVDIEEGRRGADLMVRDYRDRRSGDFGYYRQREGIDVIGLNAYTLNKDEYDAVDRRGTVVHEFGHALGLDDNDLCDRSIMCGVGETPFDTPQEHDVRDYYELWPEEE